eukprot:m.42524 g.42524  ORF g.42524 m.42524 type:complete len:53 (-) comp15032_c0_seq1:3831-3989(-)
MNVVKCSVRGMLPFDIAESGNMNDVWLICHCERAALFKRKVTGGGFVDILSC